MSDDHRPFLKVVIESQHQADMMAVVVGLSPIVIKGGLLQVWLHAWKQETDRITALELKGLVQDHDTRLEQHQFNELLDAYQAFGFLEKVEAGIYRIKGAADLHGFEARKTIREARHEANRRNGKKGGRPRKNNPEKPTGFRVGFDETEKPRKTHSVSGGFLGNPEKPSGLFQNPNETHRNPIEHRDIDHDLDPDRSRIETAPDSLSGRAGERAAVPVESAQPAESGTTGDHAARARQDDPKPVAQVASESKEAFIRRFVGAFRANTPPEPQISFHGDETPAFASSTPPPTTSPISPRGALPDDSQKEDASCH